VLFEERALETAARDYGRAADVNVDVAREAAASYELFERELA
jgi:hypothetical protein